MKNIQHSWRPLLKNQNEESSSESDGEEITRFPRFIVLEAQDDSPLATLFSVIIEKIISSNLQPKTVLKKLRNGNLGKKETRRFSAKNENFSQQKNNCLPSPKP